MTESDAKKDALNLRLLTRAFKDNPTIENYVLLRRKNPEKIIKIAISSGKEWLAANIEMLENIGIPPLIVLEMLETKKAAVSELSLLLMEKLIERDRKEKSGEAHLVSRGVAISDSLVNYLISMMLDVCEWKGDLEIPRDLIVLIRHQIGGELSSDQEKRLKTKLLKDQAALYGGQMIGLERKPSVRAVARSLEVNPSTISRLFPNNSLGEAAIQSHEKLKIEWNARKADARKKSKEEE